MKKFFCDKNRKISKATKNWLRVILSVFLLGFIGKLVLVESYSSEEEKGLSESLLSMGTEYLNRSWGEASVNEDGDISYSGNGLETKINFGADENGNELQWWIADRREASLLLFCADIVRTGVFNTYSKGLDAVGQYEGTLPNNWVTSAVRAFLGRNQGGYPGDISSRTGARDACAGELSLFESKYFTNEMVLKINPNKVLTVNSRGEKFTSLDRFWIPSAVGGTNEGKKSAVSVNPSASLDTSALDDKVNLIPPKYLKGKEFWTRSVSDEYALYCKDSEIKAAVVTEEKGYNPVMELGIQGIDFISAVQGGKADSDGIFREISSDEKSPYYLKYGPIGGAEVKLKESIETSSNLNIPYYLETADETKNAYLMAFLTNKETGKTYFASKNIQNEQNGETDFELSSVPNGKYEIKSWIEILENENGGLCKTSKVKSSLVHKGYSVTFEEAENIRFFSENNEDLTGRSIIVSENETLRYVANVEKDYNMNQLSTVLTSEAGGYDVAINPLQVSSENPYSGQYKNEISPLVVGGAVISQGLSTVVYEPREAKNYWEYEISNLTGNTAVRTTGARSPNNYKIYLASGTKKVLSSLYIDDTDISLASTNTGKSYPAGSAINIKYAAKVTYDTADMVAKFVPSSWIEKINNNGTMEYTLKESCREQYENLPALVFTYGGDFQVSSGITMPDLNSDVYLFMDGFIPKKHRILFSESSSAGLPGIFDTGELCLVEGDKETAISKLGVIIDSGERIKLRYYLNSFYTVQDNKLSLSYTPSGSTPLSIDAWEDYDTDSKQKYFEWSNIVIEGDYTFSLKTIIEKSDLEVYFSDSDLDFEEAYEVAVDSSCGTLKTVHYGGTYRFKIRPKEGYEWSEDKEFRVVTYGGEKISIDNKDSEGYYRVTICGQAGKGITSLLSINVSGAAKIPEKSNVHNVIFSDNGNNLKLYRAEESGYTKCPTAILSPENPLKFAFNADTLKSALNLEKTKATLEEEDSDSETFYNMSLIFNEMSFSVNQDMTLAFIGEDGEPQTTTQTANCNAQNLKSKIENAPLEVTSSDMSAIIPLSIQETEDSAGVVTVSGTAYNGNVSGSVESGVIFVKVTVTFENDALKEVKFEDISASTDEDLQDSNRELAIEVGGFSFIPNFESTITGFTPQIGDPSSGIQTGAVTLSQSQVVAAPLVQDVDPNSSDGLKWEQETDSTSSDGLKWEQETDPTSSDGLKWTTDAGGNKIPVYKLDTNGNKIPVYKKDASDKKIPVMVPKGPDRFAGTMTVGLDCSNLDKVGITMGHSDLYIENKPTNFNFNMEATFESTEKSWNFPKEVKPLNTAWDNAYVFGTDISFEETKEITLNVPAPDNSIMEQEISLQDSEWLLMTKMKRIGNATQVKFTVTIKGTYQVLLNTSNTPYVNTKNSSLTVSTPEMTGTDSIGVELLRAVKRGDIISDLDGAGAVTGGNTVYVLDPSADGEDESKEAFIWVDRESMQNLGNEVKAIRFSGNAQVKNDYETHTADTALNNLFKVSDVRSDSTVFVSGKNKHIVRISKGTDIDLEKMSQIKAVNYQGSTAPEELYDININETDGLAVNGGDNFKLEINVTEDYTAEDMTVVCTGDDGTILAVNLQDTESTDEKKVFVVENINQNINITVSDIRLKKFTITYPKIDGLEIYNLWGEKGTDKSGTSEEFNVHDGCYLSIRQASEDKKIFPEDGSGIDDFIKLSDATAGSGEVINVPDFEDGKLVGYTVIVKNIVGDGALEVGDMEQFKPKEHTYNVIFNYPDSVNFNWIEGVTTRAVPSNKLSVADGTTLKFTVDKQEGYIYGENAIVVHGTNGEMTPTKESINGEEKDVYTISNISRNEAILVEVKGEVTRITHRVNFAWANADQLTGRLLDEAIQVELPGREDNFVNCGIPVYQGEDIFFYVQVLEKYNQSANDMTLTPSDSTLNFAKDYGQSDQVKHRFAYKIEGGVQSDVTINIDRLEPNSSTINFEILNGNDGENDIYDVVTNEKITDIEKKLYQGDSYQFYIKKEDRYEIDSIQAISLTETPSFGYNEISVLDNAGVDNAYVVNNLYGEVFIRVTLKYKVYEVTFKEGEQFGLTGNDQLDNKFIVKSVTGNQTEIVDNRTIKVPHGEEITVTLEFAKRFDKFDGGRNASGIGSVTLRDHVDRDKITKMIKDRSTNDLQITFSFQGDNVVKLNYFEVNKYSVTFPEEPHKGYELYACSGVDTPTPAPGYQITDSVSETVPDGNIYGFYIRPLGGGFSTDNSVVTAVSSTGERTELKSAEGTSTQEYILYMTPEVYRDFSIEIEPRKHRFEVVHEGYNVSFYYPVYTAMGEVLTPLKNSDPEKDYNNKAPGGVEAGGTWTFYVKADVGYNVNEITAKTNTGVEVKDKGTVTGITAQQDKSEPADYKKFEIDSINYDTTISIDNVKVKEYPIKFELDVNSGLTENLKDLITIYDDNGNKFSWDSMNKMLYGTVQHFSKFRFKVVLNEAYSKSNLEFIPSAANVIIEGENVIKNGEYWEVSENLINKGYSLILTVRGFERNKYTVTFDGKGIIFDDNMGENISSWDEFKQIQVPNKDNQKEIMHETGELVFQVKENIEDGYSIDSDLTVKATNGSISASYREGVADGKKYKEYTLLNVTADTIVNVSGAKSIFYTIDFKTDLNEPTDRAETPPVGLKIFDTDGRDISSGIRTTNGSDVKFSIVMDDEYTQVTPNVYTDSQPKIAEEGGYYTVSNVKKNETVRIEQLKGNKNKYNVTFLRGGDFDKVEFLDQKGNPITDRSVPHGGNYSFKVKPLDGYVVSEAVVKTTNSEIFYSLDQANYLDVQISNVIGTPEISISNVTLNLYPVSFNLIAAKGEKIEDISKTAIVRAYGTGRDITSGTSVSYQKNLEFKVELSEGYTQSKVTVRYKQGDNGELTTITPAGGYYKINNIDSGITVNIEDIKNNRYGVRLVMSTLDATNVTLSQGEKSLAANTFMADVVERHGGSYSFKIEANTGYNLNNLLVTTRDADVRLDLSPDGASCTVTLENIVGDLNSVNISGINKNIFLVSFPGIEHIYVYDDSGKNITTSGKEVAFKGSVRFILEPHEGYDQAKDSWVAKCEAAEGVTINKEVSAAGQSVWSVKNITSDVKITVSGVTINTYKVNMKGSEDALEFCNSITGQIIKDGEDNWVSHGGDYNFMVRAKEGYDLLEMYIESDTGDLFEESRAVKEAIYTLKDIKKEATVKVRINKSKVEVTFKPGTGTIFQEKEAVSEITGKQTVIYGEPLEFVVRALPGYDIDTLKVNLGEKELKFSESTSEYRKFITEELKEDYEISTSIQKKKYKITFPLIDGVSFYENNEEIKGGSSIIAEYGDRLQFRVVLDGKHDQSKITVKANSSVLSLIDGFYTITEIASDINISVENVEVNRYKVNLVGDIGIQYDSSDGSEKDIKGIHVVEYGESFSFRVSPLEGYELSKMVVTVQGENGSTASITPVGSVYEIKNITENKTVRVMDQAVIQYKVEFVPADGVTYMNETGNNIKDPVLVSHGNNFEFSITIDDAYDESIPMLEASSSKSQINKMSTGRYILTNVVEDMKIKTLNVTKNRYNVTLKPITGVVYKGMGGQTLTGDQSVEHGANFQFKVELLQAYNESTISAMLGNEAIKPESDGSFVIVGIMENKTVTVTGVEENPEVKLINMINAMRDEIRDASDVDAVVEATKYYNQLTDAQKSRVTNLDKLFRLQGESGTFIHTTNDITVEGRDWYIKLVAVPLSASSDEMGRFYGELDTDFVLSLYDIYLWDMMAEKKYKLPEGQKVKVTIPTPDLTYFKDPFIVHETSEGKYEYLPLVIDGKWTSFEMTSFSPVGMAAKRKRGDVHSSFFDGVGTNLNEMKKIIMSVFNPNRFSFGSEEEEPEEPENKTSNGSADFGNENINEKFKQGNESLTRDSALRLLTILILGLLISVIIILVKNKKKSQKKDTNKFEIVEHEHFDPDYKNPDKDKNASDNEPKDD